MKREMENIAYQFRKEYLAGHVSLVDTLKGISLAMRSIADMQFDSGDYEKAERAKKYADILDAAKLKILRVK